eukprot:1993441-Pyramimonas_sp.AAC.1
MMPRGHLARVGREGMSNSFQNLHRRRGDTVIVIGMITIGAVIALAAVIVIIVTTIATINIVSTVVDVVMIPRPPKSPTRTEVPAMKCQA